MHDLWHFGNENNGAAIRPYQHIDTKKYLQSMVEKRHHSMAKNLIAWIDGFLDIKDYVSSKIERRDSLFRDAWKEIRATIATASNASEKALDRLSTTAYYSVYSNYVLKSKLNSCKQKEAPKKLIFNPASNSAFFTLDSNNYSNWNTGISTDAAIIPDNNNHC